MPESFENLSRELSEAESFGQGKRIADVCRRALESPGVQGDAERVFFFGIKLVAHLLAGEEPLSAQDVEEGVEVLQKMLVSISRARNPTEWASIQLQLGSAYFREERNLRTAISHFEDALLILSRDRSPREWALAKVAAAQAYWRLGDLREQKVAIAYMEAALNFFTLEDYPDDYKEYAEELASWRKAA